MDPDDAHTACLKQKTNLQRLNLWWQWRNQDEVNTELEQAVLDGLQPPPCIKELQIGRYSGRKYAWWMQNRVDGGVQGLPQFSCLTTMTLWRFPNLKHLEEIVELPCLVNLCLSDMPSLVSISGGPFPSLVKIVMSRLTILGELWMIAERTMPDIEEGGGCSNCTGQVQVGNCVTDLEIIDCPKLKVMPYLPSTLKYLRLSGSNVRLSGSSEPVLSEVAGLGSGRGWEMLQHMTALESLEIRYSDVLTELPESLGSLTSLKNLDLTRCSAIRKLPESLGELQSLQKVGIMMCWSLSSLPQSMGQLTSLQELYLGWCSLHELPECLGELRSLRKLMIQELPGLTCLPESMCRITSLEELDMRECSALRHLPECLGELCSLRSLYIGGCNLSSLPQSLQHLTSLQELNVGRCEAFRQLPECIGELRSLRTLSVICLPGLTCLPQSMCRLTSLEELMIFGCLGITSLPGWIKDLTTLKKLSLIGCPDLARRCERGNGEDWHLISHIPELVFF